MKFNYFILFLFCLLVAQSTSTLFAAGRECRTETDSLWNVAIQHSRYGRFDESNKVLLQILEGYRLTKKQRLAIYDRLSINSDLSGDYSLSYQYYSLKNDIEGGKSSQNSLSNQRLLAGLPEQTLSRPDKDVVVNYFIDSLFYNNDFKGSEIRLPVTIGGKEEFMILDNGCAKYSVAKESFALSHSIRKIGIEGSAIGVVDEVSMSFGIADSLSIGDMMFRNLIFIIIPDKYIDNEVLEINAMLGANIFRLAGEMVFDNVNKKIVFPLNQQKRDANIQIDSGGTHFVEAKIGDDSLLLQLDLGAASTGLNSNYFNKKKEYISSNYTARKNHIGGVGGIEEELNYIIPDFTMTSCGGLYRMKEIKVATKPRPNEEDEYGSIGNDFILSFRRVVLNLKTMFMCVE